MSKLAKDFKKYGFKGLALTLTFVLGMAVGKPAKAATSTYVAANNGIRYEQSIDNMSSNNSTVFDNKVSNLNTSADIILYDNYDDEQYDEVRDNMYYLYKETLTNQTSPITVKPKPIKMFYTDEELMAQGKDPEKSCGDNYVYVTPIETKFITNTEATSQIVDANMQNQTLTKKNTNGSITSVGVTGNKTYSSGLSAATSPNGITTVINDNNTATIYQNVNGQLMNRTISTEGTKNNSREEGQFTSEGEVNLGWWGVSTEDLGVDGVFTNSEGSTVIITNNGQTITTIDHSTGGVNTVTNSQATAKSLLARSAYYGIPYYEYTSSKGQYDAGTNLAETCMNGTCGIREVAVINNQVQLMNGETICNSNCYTL